ncbi:MAG: hypothetical protein RR250_03850 [Akkermansia sp.]
MDTKSDPASEDNMIQLLSTLRKDPAYQDDFEEKFLDEMYQRRSQELVRKPLWELIGEQAHAYLQNFRGWKWAYGAMGAVTVLALGGIALIDSDNSYSDDGTPNAGSIFGANDIGPRLQPVSIENGIPIESHTAPEQNKKIVPVSRQLREF